MILCFVGGLTAVIWTDFVQTILMILGALVLMVIGENLIFIWSLKIVYF